MKLYPQDNPQLGRIWIDNQYGNRVAELDLNFLEIDQALELSTLFAFAPDLLAACQAMLAAKDEFARDDADTLMRAAVHKATTGEQSE